MNSINTKKSFIHWSITDQISIIYFRKKNPEKNILKQLLFKNLIFINSRMAYGYMCLWQYMFTKILLERIFSFKWSAWISSLSCWPMGIISPAYIRTSDFVGRRFVRCCMTLFNLCVCVSEYVGVCVYVWFCYLNYFFFCVLLWFLESKFSMFKKKVCL